MDFKNMQQTAEQAEINSKIKPVQTKGVEIFSAIVNGKDVSKYGKQVDAVMDYMKKLGKRAMNGDASAKAEINSMRTVMVQTPLLQRLNLFSFMGNVTNVAPNEEIRYRVHQLQGKKSGLQANSGSFAFPTQTWRTQVMQTKTVSGGLAVDYREVATLDTDAMAVAQEQVITDMMNQMFNDVMVGLYAGVKAATIKNFSENAGLTKTALDEAIKKARRWGQISLMADYTQIDAMAEFAGFKNDTAGGATTISFSDAVMEEIRRTGRLNFYKGTPVVEIPNSFNTTKLNADKDYFETYLPEGLTFLVPTGQVSPLQIGIKGGVTSQMGTDIDTRLEITRFDLEWGKISLPSNAVMH